VTLFGDIHIQRAQSEYVTSSNRIVHESRRKNPPAPASTHQLSVIQGDDPANAINPNTTQYNDHPTLRTVSIPHIISHFIHVLYENGNVNTATKRSSYIFHR